jgi:SAM-dependent methyltransferase
MSSSSSSFAEIAPRYDRLRPLLEGDRRRITRLLEGVKPSDTILEVGCGTGRYTIPIAELSRARVIGVDQEPRMLEVAREKDRDKRIDWRSGTAYRLPIADQTVDLVFMAMLVHLLKQRTKALKEAARVVRQAGQLTIWTFTPGHIENYYLNGFFPSIRAIDLARFPPPSRLERDLLVAGFEKVTTRTDVDEGEVSLATVVDRVRGRYISTLSLLTPAEYRHGLQRLEELLASDPTRTLYHRFEWALISAHKP